MKKNVKKEGQAGCDAGYAEDKCENEVLLFNDCFVVPSWH